MRDRFAALPTVVFAAVAAVDAFAVGVVVPLGTPTDEIAAVALGVVVGFDAAAVALAFAALAAADPTAGDLTLDEAAVGLLPGSALRLRFTVFFLTLVAPMGLVSTNFLAVVFVLDAAVLGDFRFVVLAFAGEAGEDEGFGGGVMPSNRSSSRTLSSAASIEPPILDSRRRLD